MHYVQVGINEEGALHNQRYAFSDRYTLLTELLQNARRAGATEVGIEYDERTSVLSVTDDGCGIEDFQKLLTFHESGWDAATRAEERPFGIGFTKCLYAAARCVVNSRGQQIDFDTEAALARTPIEVVPVLDQPGTVVVLYGVDLPQLGEHLVRRCRGFPVPVFFNGKEIARPYAPEQLPLVETAIGKIHLAGTCDGNAALGTLLFLQGLCVSDQADHGRGPVNIVHLDPAQFLARLPDRDTLIDAQEQSPRIHAAMTALWREVLLARKAELEAEVFCERFFAAAQRWGCTEVFNDVPVLPRELCECIVGYPVQEGYEEATYLATCEAPITRDDVERERVRLCALEPPGEDTIAQWMLARALGFVVLNAYALHRAHWVHRSVRPLEDEAVEVGLIGEQCRAAFDSRWISLTVVLCEGYALSVAGERVEIRTEAMYDAAKQRVLVPGGERSGEVCRQVSSYIDDSDHYHEDDQEADIDAMAQLIRHLRAVDPQSTLHALVLALCLEKYPALRGKSFQVKVGANDREHAVALLG